MGSRRASPSRVGVLPSILTAIVVLWPLAAHAQLDLQQYAAVSPASGWRFVTGEFTGDSRSDLAAYHPSDGSVWVGRNVGDRFAFRRCAGRREPALAPYDEVASSGTVAIPAHLRGTTIGLAAIADTCGSTEFLPAFCLIEESNEDNTSDPVIVTIP